MFDREGKLNNYVSSLLFILGVKEGGWKNERRKTERENQGPSSGVGPSRLLRVSKTLSAPRNLSASPSQGLS